MSSMLLVTTDFSFLLGISVENFLCISELDENECLSPRLDGDETAHQQVSIDSI